MGNIKLILILIFILNTAIAYSASQVITVVENPQPQESFSLKEFFFKYWVFILLITVVLALLIWLLVWIVNKIKEGRDVWYQVTKHKKHLCKIHKDKFRVRAFFRYSKNCPIRVIHQTSGRIYSRTVGYYRGHYLSHEGNFTILFNCRRKWLIFPKNEILIINTKPQITMYETKARESPNKKTEMVKEAITVDVPHDLITFNPDEIILHAHAIDMDIRTNFYYPVLKDKDGKVMNMFFPTYETMKEVVIESYLFDQTDDFVRVAKKSIDLNPLIRGHNKVLDSSSSIETQETQVKR